MGAGGDELAGTNAILLAGGSIERFVLLIVFSMASAAFRLASFLDLPLPVHSRLPIVTLVSNVLWWGGPSPLDTSNSGFCSPFLSTTSCRWPTGLLCGASAELVVHCWYKEENNIRVKQARLVCLQSNRVYTEDKLKSDLTTNNQVPMVYNIEF